MYYAQENARGMIRPLRLSAASRTGSAQRLWSGRVQRLWRAIKRQTPLMLAVACLTWIVGSSYGILNGAAIGSVWIWGAFSLAIAALLAAAHEIERGAIANVATAERASRRRVSSAAPHISARMLRGLSPDMRTPLGYAIYRPESDYATSIRHFLSTVGNAKVIAIVGSTPRNGATATAASVAAIASQQSKRVLLVDCDLRQRGTTRLFEAEPETGVLKPQSIRASGLH